jgi:hypothetical protein
VRVDRLGAREASHAWLDLLKEYLSVVVVGGMPGKNQPRCFE